MEWQGMYWDRKMMEALEELAHPENQRAVMEVFHNINSDCIIEGEDPLYDGYQKLREMGEEKIAEKYLAPELELQREMIQKQMRGQE
ncbi:MAG: hypothetical protein Q4E76_00960 [Tissierellia bacterium]|nr:hypothetical protein [Tissierellia bacterium]